MLLQRRIFCLFVGLLLTTACADRRRLSEMHDSTNNMNQTTTKLDKKTEKLLNAINEVYDGGRQGSASQLRREAMRALIEADTMGKKIAEATLYFDSFEFQVWHGDVEGDSLKRRQHLIDDAVTEFFAAVNEFWEDSEDVDPTAQKQNVPFVQDGNKAACFNALAFAMDIFNRKQLEIHKLDSDVPLVSFYSLIAAALVKESDVNFELIDLADLTIAEKMILSNEQVAMKLLQARQNMMSMVALSKVSPVGLEGSAWGFLRAYFSSWPLDLEIIPIAIIDEAYQYLEKAEETRALLKSLSVEPRVDGRLTKIWRNAKVPDTSRYNRPNVAADFELDLKTKFLILVGQNKRQ